MNDFYVGYLPKAPTALARFVRRVIIVLGLLAVTTALVLVVGQMPFANSAFEYGKVRSFEGVVVTQPFPTLLVARPGAVGQQDKYSRYLLVAPGKHGADDLVASVPQPWDEHGAYVAGVAGDQNFHRASIPNMALRQ